MLVVYSKKIQGIKDEILAIGDTIIEANETALKALKSSKYELFESARKSLQDLEKASDNVDNMIVNILALYSPEAKDLRLLVSYLKITEKLIRASDNTKYYIKDISKLVLKDIKLKGANKHIIELHSSTIKALKKALKIAHIKYENAEQSESKQNEIFEDVQAEENKTDELCKVAQNYVFNLIAKQKDGAKEYYEILSSIRRLEKIADRAVSIANLLLFAKQGGKMHQV